MSSMIVVTPTPILAGALSALLAVGLATQQVSAQEVTVPPRPAQQPADGPLMFEAVLRGENVAPEAVQTSATAVAAALLVGDTLLVSGSFTGLSSGLRDLEATPADPGVHIHPGAAGETNPYLFGLRVELDDSGLSGTFAGRFVLSGEQASELRAGRIYIDIHTLNHRPGEVRDQFRERSVPAEDAAAFTASFMASFAASFNAGHDTGAAPQRTGSPPARRGSDEHCTVSAR